MNESMNPMSPMINVGASKEAIGEARAVIVTILNIGASDQVKLAALKTLTKICAVKGTMISGCTLTNNREREIDGK